VVSQVSQIKPLSISLLHYVCHMPNISHLLVIITMITLGEEFKSTVSLLYLFLQRHINSSLLLNSLDLRSSLHLRNHLSTNTRKVKVQIAMLCVCKHATFVYSAILHGNNNFAIQSKSFSYDKRLSGLEPNGKYFNVLAISYMLWNYGEQNHIYANPHI